MSLIDDVAKLLVPGTGSFFALSLTAGGLLLAAPRRWRRAGAALIVATTVLYAALANPSICNALEHGLTRGYQTVREPSDAGDARTVVVIGNGVTTHLHGDRYVDEMQPETAHNVAEGARLFALLGSPLVIVSGGIADPASQSRTEASMMREALMRAGVPAARIVMEEASTNTYEQAREVTSILARRRIDRFVVVTAPMHMRRVDSLFRRQGRRPIASIPLSASQEITPSRGELFSAAALRGSRDAAYEYTALLGYWLRGRI